MAIPADIGARNHQAFIETSTGVVARRSHISGGTLTAVSGTVSTHITGGTVDALTAVIGTVNIIAILGTVTSLQGGTIDKLASGTVNTVGMLQAGSLDILKAGTLDMIKAGTIDKVASGTIDTVSLLSAGTVTTVGMVQAGTTDMLKAGTLDMVKAGTVSMLVAGTVDTNKMLQAGTLDMVKDGTISMLKAGTIDKLAGGTVNIQIVSVANDNGDGYTNNVNNPSNTAGGAIIQRMFPYNYNGTTWDRVRGLANATNSTGIGINAAGLLAQLDDTSPTAITENYFGNVRMSPVRSLHVEQPFSGTHLAANGTTTISSAAGLLHLVTINTAGATGTITLTDGTAGGGGTIAIISGNAQTTLGYNSRFTTGLSAIIASGTPPDVSISYR